MKTKRTLVKRKDNVSQHYHKGIDFGRETRNAAKAKGYHFGKIINVVRKEEDIITGQLEPAVVDIEYNGKIYYSKTLIDGPSISVDDWDSMVPPPPQYEYVVLRDGTEVIVIGMPENVSERHHPLAGKEAPHGMGKYDIYGGL